MGGLGKGSESLRAIAEVFPKARPDKAAQHKAVSEDAVLCLSMPPFVVRLKLVTEADREEKVVRNLLVLP